MDFDAAQKWLDGLPAPVIWDLERMRAIVREAGLQTEKINAVQVAGTNGKGSTCAFLAEIFKDAGLKIGLYTSPHLLDIRERIQVNGVDVPRKDFATLTSWAKPLVERHGASQFEALTLMAFKHFLDQNVDWAVVEAGMGGRLDATSILTPKIAIITNIGLEHTAQLGRTLEKIAVEKAGIIPKNGVVLTAAEGKALQVIRKVAREKNACVEVVPPLAIVNQKPLTLRIDSENVMLALQGTHQAQNAALAVAAAHELQRLGVRISNGNICNGLENARWPARMQNAGNVIIDGAHNPHGISALMVALRGAFPRQKWNLIFGVLADKNYAEMVQTLKKMEFGSIQLVTPKSPRSLPAEKLAAVFKEHGLDASVAHTMKKALEKNGKKPTLVCGSLYVAAEALEIVGKK